MITNLQNGQQGHLVKVSMKAGPMAMHACQIGPTDMRPLPGIALRGLHRNKGECFETGNLSAPISPLLTH